MAELADASMRSHEFLEIMDLLDKRLNDSGKNWRHVFKALTLLDYLLHCGTDSHWPLISRQRGIGRQ